MAKKNRRPQWEVRLDAYHRFVVERFTSAFGTTRSKVLARMIEQWVVDHPDLVVQARCSLADWQEVRKERDPESE